MICCSLAPCFSASAVCPLMQYGHWVTCATATAINCLVTFGNAPSANTAALNALNAFSGSGASSRRLCAISAEDGGYIDVSMTDRSEEQTSEPQSPMRISYAVF